MRSFGAWLRQSRYASPQARIYDRVSEATQTVTNSGEVARLENSDPPHKGSAGCTIRPGDAPQDRVNRSPALPRSK